MRWFIPLVLGLMVVAGCSTGSGGDAEALPIVATTAVIADLARNVGGDYVSVYDVIKPNVDPHDYEPSVRDLVEIGKARVIVENGVGLERWLANSVAASNSDGVVVDASNGVTIRLADGQPDPHIWTNPRNVTIMVDNIARAFGVADPEHASAYLDNASRYDRDLDELDNNIAAQINALSDKKLVTNHDAFGYYVDHYGMQFVGSIIPSSETSAELSASEIEQLVTKIRAEHVKAVFAESALPAAVARTIANEAGVTVVAGSDALYGDGLGTRSSPAGTYLDMMRHNTSVIVSNLQ